MVNNETKNTDKLSNCMQYMRSLALVDETKLPRPSYVGQA